MSKALSSMAPAERAAAIARRLAEKQGGLGYLAALDAMEKIGQGQGQGKRSARDSQSPSGKERLA